MHLACNVNMRASVHWNISGWNFCHHQKVKVGEYFELKETEIERAGSVPRLVEALKQCTKTWFTLSILSFCYSITPWCYNRCFKPLINCSSCNYFFLAMLRSSNANLDLQYSGIMLKFRPSMIDSQWNVVRYSAIKSTITNLRYTSTQIWLNYSTMSNNNNNMVIQDYFLCLQLVHLYLLIFSEE